MSKQIIIMDTGSAPTDDIVQKYDNLEIMKMKVVLDGKAYTDGEEIDHNAYYSKVDKIKEFDTSPPLLSEMKKKYEYLRNKGCNQIIAIHTSSKLSKIIEISEKARTLVQAGIDIKIIDTENMGPGAYLVAEKVIELIYRGKTYEKITELLPKLKSGTYLQTSLSTSKYTVKNKKAGTSPGLMDKFLKVRPILAIDREGYLSPVSNEKGRENVIDKITDNAVKFIEKRPYNVKVYVSYGLEKDQKEMDELTDAFMGKFEKLKIRHYNIIKNRMWPTMACMSGPDTYGLAIYGEELPID
ncbi:MAG: DegV family EDD domain-containing protein [Desulfobacteraceae bacterium]|nr:DegV family EDD domain-containing protein [Desulfobacteraceae bacterium]